jgi:hypothetical protein
MSTATVEPTVVDCTKCGGELSKRNRPLCQSCVDDACADVNVDCMICGLHNAERCDDCASGATAERVREYADRRKMLGLMSPEIYAAFELRAEDLES